MLPRSCFPLCNRLGLEVGQRVAYVCNLPGVLDALAGGVPGRAVLDGEGTITLVWLGIEEAVDVTSDAGDKVTLYPALGDLIEVS